MVRAKVLGAAVLAAGMVTGLATAAQAGPYGYGPPEETVVVERVAGGCGPGFHPNPWGHCRPNGWGWGGYGGRPAYGHGGGYGYGGGYGGQGGYAWGGPRRPYGGW